MIVGEPLPLPERWHSRAAHQMVADWTSTAASLSSIGPPLAYVGFSMGAVFGALTVAAIDSIKAAVFVAGGIPTGGGVNDPPLRALLLQAAAGLEGRHLLMINMSKDDVFATEDTHAFFDAVPGRDKRLMFWEGRHDEWPAEAIGFSIDFINQHR